MKTSNWTNDALKWGLAILVFWYVTTRTDIGRGFVSDTSTIYQQTGFPEGLKSAYQLISKEK